MGKGQLAMEPRRIPRESLATSETSPYLYRVASRSSDKDGDSVHTASDVPLTPRTSSPDGRRSSSDTSKSTYSLTRRVSSK